MVHQFSQSEEQDVTTVRSQFGIRGYKYDQVSFGLNLYCTRVEEKRYISLNLDFYHISLTFGWSLIPLDGDGGRQLA